MYERCLRIYLDKSSKKLANDEARSRWDTTSIYLIDDFIDLPPNINRHNIVSIGSNNIDSIALANDSDFHAIKLEPIEIAGGDILIGLLEYRVTGVKGNIRLVNNGSLIFRFSYERMKKVYILKAINSVVL